MVVGCEGRGRQLEKTRQGRQRACGDHVGSAKLRLSRDFFDSLGADVHSCSGAPGDLAEEGGLARIAFDERDLSPVAAGEHNCEDHPGETGAGTEVEPALGIGRGEREELGGIGEVARPDAVQRARGDEIDGLLPLPQQGLVSRKFINRFT